jgi:pyruvate,water dikinase
MRPDDPHEFLELLAATDMASLRRNDLLQQLADLARDDPSRVAQALGGARPAADEFGNLLTQYLADFASPDAPEERAAVLQLIRKLASGPPRSRVATAHESQRRAQEFLAACSPEQREQAAELLDLGRASYRLRDDDNIHLGRLQDELQRAVQEVHRRPAGEALGRDATWKEGVALLRGAPAASVTETPPPTDSGPLFVTRPRQLRGQPSGPGFARGIARVVVHRDDRLAFEPDEILVCDAIDPNMTSIVLLCRGIVERRGGMLIHGAIIAREYGLPCVTGVPDATSLISNGDPITVDGYLGIVTVGDARPGDTHD